MFIQDLAYALKLIKEEYRLLDDQVAKIHDRLIADDREFDKLWRAYKKKGPEGRERFKEILGELLD